MNLSIERYQILKSTKKKNSKTHIIRNKKKIIYNEKNTYKIISYNKIFVNNIKITKNSKLLNTNIRNYENVLKKNKVYIKKQKLKKSHFIPENLDIYMRKNCMYYSKKKLSENKSVKNNKKDNNFSIDSNKINHLNIFNNSNNDISISNGNDNLNIEVNNNCISRNIINNTSNISNTKNEKYDNMSNFQNGNLNNDTKLHEFSINNAKDKKKKKKKINDIYKDHSNYTNDDLLIKKLKLKNLTNNSLLDTNNISVGDKMKNLFKINNKKTNQILLSNKNCVNIDLLDDQKCTNKDNSFKCLNKTIINNNNIELLKNNKNKILVKNSVNVSSINKEQEFNQQKNIKSKEDLKNNALRILSKYNLICHINENYDIIEKKNRKNIFNSENFTDSEIEKYKLYKNKINARKNILGNFYTKNYKKDYFYISKDSNINNFKNIIIKNLSFKKSIVNSCRHRECSIENLNKITNENIIENKNKTLNEKLRNDVVESSNVCCDLDKNTHTDIPENVKIFNGFSNYEEIPNEQKGFNKSTLNSVINNFNLCFDYSSISDFSLNHANKKQNNKIVHTNENSTCDEKKNSEKNFYYEDTKKIKKNFINKNTVCNYNINNTNMCESAITDKEKIYNKEKLKKNANLKRNLDNDLNYNSNKKMKNEEYSLINFNIYKNNVTDICKNNSYNTYILKSLGNSYLKNKLNCKDTKVKTDNAPKINAFDRYPNSFNLNKEGIFNNKNNKLNENEIKNLQSKLIKNEMDKKLNATKIIINNCEENNYIKQEDEYDQNDRENIDNYENENFKCCKVNSFTNKKKNSIQKLSINNADNSASDEVNYTNFLKDKDIDIFNLDLRDIVKLLEKEKIENLYSEEELKNLLIPVNGIYYDTNKKSWICKYIDIKNVNHNELNGYFLLKEQNNAENLKKKIFSTKSFSYHESRQLALEFKYKHVKKKYSILKNLSEEENIFFKSINNPTENSKYTKLKYDKKEEGSNEYDEEKEENEKENEMQKGESKEEQNKNIKGEYKKEEKKKTYSYDKKSKNCSLYNSMNKNVGEINLNKTLKILNSEITHKLYKPLLKCNVNENDSISEIKNDENKNNCIIDINNINNDNITNLNKCTKVMVSNDNYRLINENDNFDSYNKNQNYTYDDNKSYISFKTKKNLCKLLGVNVSDDIEEKMKNLHKENIFYEKEEKKWVIKIYEKKSNILLYFKEFDCKVFGFLYACYLSIEHKRLYLDYFLNEKNYNFLIKLVYRSCINNKMHNTIARQISLNKNHNYSVKDVNEIKKKLKIKNLEKYSLETIDKEHRCLEINTIEKNNIRTKNLEEEYVKTDFEKENLIFHNISSNNSEKPKDCKNRNCKDLEKDKIFIDEKNNSLSNFQKTKNQTANKLSGLSCYLENNFEKGFSKTLNSDSKQYRNIKCIKYNNDIENEKKHVKIENIKEKEEHKEDQGQKEQCNSKEDQKENDDNRKKDESYNFNTNNNITLNLNFGRNNNSNENSSSNITAVNLYKSYTTENNEIPKDQMQNVHEKNEKKKKKKKYSSFYKKTKTVKNSLVNLKNSNVTSDILQEERNNLIKLDSYVDILSQKSDITSLAKQTILLLLKDILNCIPFQMAPSITSKKIYDQKIHAHIKFVYQSKNLFDLMPYFFIFKNIIKQKTLPSNQSLYICNVLLYALFEA
ncbi:conserved Plasmodium protein, unknown function [Plasmodium gallinaceum]|uniref:AP2-coincident C-terminal domain-containing protein n=1 Tax=Plasmodium gallinaceum TaxID=5849 RepID=A0A1J1GYE4_PLAGA|nr:conserved Plasmodium protein, unknown function [Plasmodium gallinaceum]CRG97586.1 conserved Plasmodium protein, unknown function [Plasmodium gallinaceum]